MMFSRIKVEGVRNLSFPSFIELSPSINCICGSNGSGKSTFLESLHILALGRSFRNRSLQPVICHSGIHHPSDSMLLVAELASGGILGFEYQRSGDRRIRYQGESLNSSAEMARLLPIQLLDHQIFHILEGGPKPRRQLLDWGVFHVEQAFLDDWRAYQAALKQRNAQLRNVRGDANRLTESEWVLWERPLIQYAKSIQSRRKRYLERISPLLAETLNSFMPALAKDIQVSLQSGWRADAEFAEVLVQQREVDVKQGFTGRGPHRADLRLTYQGVPADQRLSRGQQKMLVSAFKVAQAALHKQVHQKSTIFLLDDLAAELDQAHRMALCQWLESLECQTFITCIDASTLRDCWAVDTEVYMFHVEHGQLTQGRS
jgi:DNA replication and repair protein RecF